MSEKKHIVIDLQSYEGESGYRGIGRVSWEITKRLIEKMDEKWKITILLNDLRPERGLKIRNELLKRSQKVNVEVIELTGFTTYFDIYESEGNLKKAIAYEVVLEYFISQLYPDIYFNPSHFEWDHPTSLKKIGGYWVDAVILYDLIPYIFREKYLKWTAYRAWFEHKIEEIKKYDVYFGISNSTKKDFEKYLGIDSQKIKVIPLAADEKFKELDKKEKEDGKIILKEKYHINPNYIFYVPGGFEERKNFENLFKAYSSLPEELKKNYLLVIGSKMDENTRRHLESLSKKLGIEDRVIFTGYVSDEELVILYNNCSLFVFPSLYEGFGLPIVEAMRCGAPVISSDRAGMKEIVVSKDAMFNPEKPDEISEKMRLALTNENYKLFLIENSIKQREKYSWEKAVEIIAETFEGAI